MTKPFHSNLRMAERITIGIMILSFVVATIVAGPLSVWSAFPAIAYLGLLLRCIRRYASTPFPITAGTAASAIIATGMVLWLHIDWAFDLNRIATRSSTSALAFLFVPIHALFAGGAAFLIVAPVSLGLYLLFTRHK
jgi:hypothetical protein